MDYSAKLGSMQPTLVLTYTCTTVVMVACGGSASVVSDLSPVGLILTGAIPNPDQEPEAPRLPELLSLSVGVRAALFRPLYAASLSGLTIVANEGTPYGANRVEWNIGGSSAFLERESADPNQEPDNDGQRYLVQLITSADVTLEERLLLSGPEQEGTIVGSLGGRPVGALYTKNGNARSYFRDVWDQYEFSRSIEGDQLRARIDEVAIGTARYRGVLDATWTSGGPGLARFVGANNDGMIVFEQCWTSPNMDPFFSRTGTVTSVDFADSCHSPW